MKIKSFLPAFLILLAASLPIFITTPYYLRVLILAGIFMVLAISYDLIAGQVGALSLAHPAFYGIGAYTVAILVTKAGWGFVPSFVVAAAIASVMAIAIGIPSFRLEESTFAIGTLGFLLILKLVATNWIGLTEGPMCTTGVLPLEFVLPGGYVFSTTSLRDTYYGIMVLTIAAYIIARVINSSRLGRAFHGVRENQLLAEMEGVHALFYKMFAFVVGAAIASIAGGYYGSYSSLVCPSEMELWYVITLLIIINLGGAGSLRGVMTAAVIFTVLPEVLRISPQLRLVIYGLLLLIFALYLPGGFEGLFQALETRLSRPKSISTYPRED
jgi:ABC-type branched-subunit amino acid transport system permease subunit